MESRLMAGHPRAAVRLSALVAVTLGLLALYLGPGKLSPGLRRRCVRIWHRSACRIAGLRLRVHGVRAAAPALLASNHVSYLDVPAIAAEADAVFIAKREVAGWPAIGWLARLIGTIFVARETADTKRQVTVIAKALVAGARIVVFPEATSTVGTRVLGYKSSLFAAPVEAEAAVQPVTVGYARDRRGRPLDAARRRRFAWIGDDTLVPHLWAILMGPGITVDVMFHRPVPASAFASRKQLADYCRRESAAGLAYLERLAAVTRAGPAGPRLWADWVDYPAFGLLD